MIVNSKCKLCPDCRILDHEQDQRMYDLQKKLNQAFNNDKTHTKELMKNE